MTSQNKCPPHYIINNGFIAKPLKMAHLCRIQVKDHQKNASIMWREHVSCTSTKKECQMATPSFRCAHVLILARLLMSCIARNFHGFLYLVPTAYDSLRQLCEPPIIYANTIGWTSGSAQKKPHIANAKQDPFTIRIVGEFFFLRSHWLLICSPFTAGVHKLYGTDIVDWVST